MKYKEQDRVIVKLLKESGKYSFFAGMIDIVKDKGYKILFDDYGLTYYTVSKNQIVGLTYEDKIREEIPKEDLHKYLLTIQLSGYSLKESQLIKALSPKWYNNLQNKGFELLPQPKLYDILALEAFRTNQTGKAVESLRRITTAFFECSAYRETPEFEALIEL